ncbi:alpha-amylase [Schizosaccharomyces japonicus yFS275]|uniref:Alpha-amylase n=1 Tax=Schizosaccharomyces japonicus (strain yFS275 / FY16936) TaxID=402676 RepID=B6JVR9_SCHJY|nr:alpha-amylase [Schizosaccharomyces japonicus yFS275]EEB05470.1 alpha-amylase [Schizosaccharomyces japonicus yFS275]
MILAMFRPFLSCLGYTPKAPEKANDYGAAIWRKQNIYQLLTDRFARNEDDYDHPATGRLYLGGTWRGIISKLDYLQSLGITAVWISPIVKNIEETTGYGQAYHGYWTEDMTELNSHFGTADDLRALVQALHERNMLCMIDIVVNHMAHSGSGPVNFARYRPFHRAEDYHEKRFIRDYDNLNDCLTGWLGDNVVCLPDIRTENPRICSIFQNWIAFLHREYNFDGIRVDTAKHVQKTFYPPFVHAANVFAMAEVFHGDPAYVGVYQHYLPSVLNYPLYYQLRDTFLDRKQNMSVFYQKAVLDIHRSFYDVTTAGNFVENHDVPRFLHTCRDYSLAVNALVATIFMDGFPIIYQGQEQMYNGGDDPENRDALWKSRYDTTNSMFRVISSLLKYRLKLCDIYSNFTTEPTQPLLVNDQLYAFTRPGVYVILTNMGSTFNSRIQIPLRTTCENKPLVDAFDEKPPAGLESRIASSTLHTSIQFGFPKVLIDPSILY